SGAPNLALHSSFKLWPAYVALLLQCVSLSNPEFIGRLQRSATAPADDRRAVAASQGIGNFYAALRAIERLGLRLWLWIGHKEENSSTESRHTENREPGTEFPLQLIFFVYLCVLRGYKIFCKPPKTQRYTKGINWLRNPRLPMRSCNANSIAGRKRAKARRWSTIISTSPRRPSASWISVPASACLILAPDRAGLHGYWRAWYQMGRKALARLSG